MGGEAVGERGWPTAAVEAPGRLLVLARISMMLCRQGDYVGRSTNCAAAADRHAAAAATPDQARLSPICRGRPPPSQEPAAQRSSRVSRSPLRLR